MQQKNYIKPYIKILKRNKRGLYSKLLKLAEQHIERIEEIDPELMTETEQIKLVLEYYRQATDRNNPMRVVQDLDEAMHGKLVSAIQSYDLLDNQKYIQIDKILDFMTESFGYNEDILDNVRNSIN